ncbi:transcription factor IIF subunit tfg1 [Coemansia sp. IMI 209127]|nr:transcription factor IIF subunit tfg1 [Coemansia sp. IMI 209127]
MSSGIRRTDRKPSSLGSAGIRNTGVRSQAGSSGVGRRVAPGARPANHRMATQPKADADIPLAAGVSKPQDTRSCIEYPLMSATPQSTHNVMRFLDAGSINMRELTQPVKLRRRNREYYRLKNKKRDEERAALLAAKTEKDLRIDDGKKSGPAESDQKADSKGPASVSATTASATQQANDPQRPKADIGLIADMGGARRNKKNLFKKRTKQVYFADEEKRRLDIEEARPWVLEDDDEKDVWTGSLEGAQSSSYVLFVLTDDGFKVVPVDRWYKFTPKLKYKTLTLDEAEEVLKSEQKIDSRSRWIMRKHMQLKDDDERGKEKEPSSARPVKSTSLVEYEAMDEDDDLFADDGESTKRNKRSVGKNGGFDEVNFEREFDDDEELGDVQFEYNEEESREKDEQKRRDHATGFGSDDDDEDAGAQDKLDDDGKTIKKLIRKREDGKEYESDKDEEDPYLSLSEFGSDESDSDDDAVKKEGDQQQQQQQQGDNAGAEAAHGAQKSVSPSPSTASASASASAAASNKKRKRISVVGPLLAASSPHEKSIKHAKSTHHLGRAQSGGSAASRGGGPSSGGGSSSGGSSDLITRQEIIDLIKSGVNTTKDLIGCVRKKLKANPENKKRIQTIVKDVAILKNDRLALKTTAEPIAR